MNTKYVTETTNTLYLINSVILEDTRNVIMSSSFSNETIIPCLPYMLSGLFFYYQQPFMWYDCQFKLEYFNQCLLLSVCFPHFFNILNLYYIFYCLSQFVCMNSSSFLKKKSLFSVCEIAFIPHYCYELKISI